MEMFKTFLRSLFRQMVSDPLREWLNQKDAQLQELLHKAGAGVLEWLLQFTAWLEHISQNHVFLWAGSWIVAIVLGATGIFFLARSIRKEDASVEYWISLVLLFSLVPYVFKVSLMLPLPW